ncbi:DUF814 domain-containing protein [Candidatus Woesearchaeota archaeon]|nr:DUF814 domain-containing protein [Candidatus Woesearchaeota archaeon]
MELTLRYDKTVEENAAAYYDKAKKAKKKLDGARKALEAQQKKVLKLEKDAPLQEEIVIKAPVKREWFEKYHWCYSSDNVLIVAGRDATTNEIIIKKNTEKTDVVLHTDMAGSPFAVIKTDGKKSSELTLLEAAQLVAIFSKAFKRGMGSIEVFWVNPEQVTKDANPGEFLPKGAFMIRGKTNYLSPTMSYAIGNYGGRAMGGPLTAIKKHCKEYIELVQGDQKISDIAKQVAKKISISDVDEVMRTVPQGSKIK